MRIHIYLTFERYGDSSFGSARVNDFSKAMLWLPVLLLLGVGSFVGKTEGYALPSEEEYGKIFFTNEK